LQACLQDQAGDVGGIEARGVVLHAKRAARSNLRRRMP
jgi:hypothetical protein